jgi:type IV pilus assembly protein PilV
MQLKMKRLPSGSEDGFTLIELLITLVIVSVGMLGLAKLQASAIAETSTTRTRSIMAFQAESLAGAMRANRAFWADTTVTAPSVVIPAASGGNYTVAAGNVPSVGSLINCGSQYCTKEKLAGWDVQQWANTFGVQFPTATASVVCSTGAGTPVPPVNCDITLNWSEHYVGINKSTTAAGAAFTGTGNLVVHVQP